MKVHYVVRTTTKDPEKLVSVSIRIKAGSVDQAIASRYVVRLKYWNVEKQEIRRTAFPGKADFLAQLSDLENHVLKCGEGLATVPPGWLKYTVDLFHNPDQGKEKPVSMFDWIPQYIDNCGKSSRVVYSYYNVLDLMKEYKPRADWFDLDLDYYDGFTQFLVDKGLAKNTVADKIKVLKVFCNASYNREIHTNAKFKLFKKQTEESIAVYLDDQELNRIYKCNLSRHPHLETVRDQFLIGCWSGCRFGDIKKITNENIKNGFVYIEQQKTRKRVIIPLHPVTIDILSRYDGTPPEPISNQKFNQHIKRVVMAARIKNTVTKGITKGGERVFIKEPKYKFVSSHTARRSFATNLYKSGFPAISIMAITGHKTQEAFLKYIKVSEEEHAALLMKHWNRLTQAAG